MEKIVFAVVKSDTRELDFVHPSFSRCSDILSVIPHGDPVFGKFSIVEAKLSWK